MFRSSKRTDMKWSYYKHENVPLKVVTSHLQLFCSLWFVLSFKTALMLQANYNALQFFYQKSLGLKTEQFCYSSGITDSPSESSLLHYYLWRLTLYTSQQGRSFILCDTFGTPSTTQLQSQPGLLIVNGKISYSANS